MTYTERDVQETDLTNIGFVLAVGPHRFLCRYTYKWPEEDAGTFVRRPAGAIAVHTATGRYVDIACGLWDAKLIALAYLDSVADG